jgi:hypothetical protein
MLKIVSRALATLGLAVVLLAPSFQASIASAQATPEPPVQLVIGTAALGSTAAVAVLINNRTQSQITNIDLRCAFPTDWNFVQAYAGDSPDFARNRGVLNRYQVIGPDGSFEVRQVVGWIHQYPAVGRPTGPFIYVVNTNNRAGLTWCYANIIAGTHLGSPSFNRAITSDTYAFVPGS